MFFLLALLVVFGGVAGGYCTVPYFIMLCLILHKLRARTCRNSTFGYVLGLSISSVTYDKVGQYALVSVYCCPRLNYLIYLSPRVINRSIDHIYNYILIYFLLLSIFHIVSFNLFSTHQHDSVLSLLKNKRPTRYTSAAVDCTSA